jgi:serine/threonine protein kinase
MDLNDIVPSDTEIVTACEQQSLGKDSYGFLVYPSREAPTAFIKCGHEEFGIKEEMRNQVFAFKALEKLPPQQRKCIQVPKIYRVIEKDKMIYIVMEYVRGRTLAELRAKGDSVNELQEEYEQIAKAIMIFLAFDIPDQTPLGPAGGGIIKHPLFKDTVASLKYESVDQLQEHLTRVRLYTSLNIHSSNCMQVANCPNNNNLKIDFTGEKLCFCFADLFEGNFIFTESNTLYIVDFHHAAFLPTSFMTYALDQPRPVCAAIKDKFALPQNNLAAMRVAGYYFMIGSRKIGMYLRKLFVHMLMFLTKVWTLIKKG